MKENFNGKELGLTMDNEKLTEFNKKLNLIKERVVKFRELEKESVKLQLEARKLADSFVEEFKENKPELGKSVSWIGDVYRRDELVSILGDSIEHKLGSKNSLDLELEKVPRRLHYGLERPEYYSNERVSNLVEVLNTYDNYIDTFESIELCDESNCLDKNNYLIGYDLHNLLINGYRLQRDRTISKEERGVYIVVFKKIFVEGKETLVYQFIKYPYIFYDCLYHYFIQESSSLVINNGNSVGTDYLFVIENVLYDKESLDSFVKKVSENFNLHSLHGSRGIFPRNVVDMVKMLLKGCPMIMSNEAISKYVELSLQRNIYDIVEAVVKLYGFYDNESQNKGLEVLKENLEKPKYENYNILGRTVFVTDDLDSLIKKLKGLFGGSVNAGPQKWRGQSNSLSNTINSIDTDFRKSMNRHNQFHVNHGNIPRNSLIGRSKFSYQNIHLNIGNVRWYSTNRSMQPEIHGSQEVFYDIAEYIKRSPINKDTQLKIESSLYDYSYITLTENMDKSDKPVINYKLINKRFSDLLIEERERIVDYINRSRELSFEKEPTKANDLIQYLLSTVLKELKDDYIISVIYGRLFKIVSRYHISIDSNKAVDIFVDIGTDLIQNYFYVLYSKHKSQVGDRWYKLSDWKRENSNLVSKYDDTVRAELGGKIVSWLKNIDLITIQLITKGKTNRENVIAPTDRILEVLDKENKIKPLPRRLPMIIKPSNYSRTYRDGKVKELLGGYLLNDEKYMDPLIIPKWNFGKPTLIKDENLVYDLVNNINSVAFKINKDVLDFIASYGSRYGLIIDSSYTHPLSAKDKLSKQEFTELSSFLSKKSLQDNILAIADMYSNLHEFFLPTRLDSRGRLYCISEYLNYQSTELAKSLLLFAESERIYKYDKVSINYLKAYGANCFGNKLDKMSWKARSKWVDDNLEKIVNFRDGELIEKAEKKLLFISFCFEYNRFLECLNNDKDYFETYLPIQLDATCNGYQHLSLLSLDYDLAKELNLTQSTWDDQPKDFYNFTAVKLINYFKSLLGNNNLTDSEREVYTRFSQLTIARKIVKKVIMTIPYNVTYLTIVDYLKSNFSVEENGDMENRSYFYKEDSSIRFKETDFPLLAKGLKVVLFDDRFKLKRLLSYLNEVAKVVTNLDLPISWGTPDSGVNIEQSYLDSKEERLKVFSYTKKTFKVKVADRSKMNKRKQRVSFLPNFIHSLDAASLALLVHYYFTDASFKTKNIYTIHDCFAVTANNVKNLIYLLSHVYQKIYTEKNYLREFDQKMIEFIKYNCKKDISFDMDTLVITTKEGTKLQYPSVESVLGPTCTTDGLVKDSPYLIH